MINSTKIPNTLLKNPDLSLQSKGLYTILAYLSNIPDFVLTQKSIQAFADVAINSVKNYMKELKEAGYVRIVKYSENNTFKYNYILTNTENNFSFVANEIVADKTLKCGHKGLYAIFSAFRTDHSTKADISLIHLKTLSKNGERSFNNIFRELKTKGLINQIRTCNGRYEYIFNR